MNKQELQVIKLHLQEYRKIKAERCSRVDPNDGDQGACYAYEVDPIDRVISDIDDKINMLDVQQVAQVHSDINEKLFGYFKL